MNSVIDNQRTDLSVIPSSRIRFARLIWVFVILLSLSLFIGGLPGRYHELSTSVDPRVLNELGLTAIGYATYFLSLSVLVVFTHNIIAAVIFIRRKYDWMALALAFTLVTNGVIFPLSLMYPSAVTPEPTRTLVESIVFFGLLSSTSLLYLFPNGRFVPNWTKWMVVIWGLITLPSIFFPNLPISLQGWPVLIQLLILFIWGFTGVAAQIYRFVHVSNWAQRQQAKWALLGLTATVLGPFAYFVPFIIVPSLTSGDIPNLLFNRLGASFYIYAFILRIGGVTAISLLSLLFPISFAIAIFRYKLWDIDIIINRALVYAALTGLLGLLYFTSVVLFQRLIQLITGFSQTEIATAASTLLIAALFVPLQRRVQAAIDKRFYRRKYNMVQTLAAFNATLRDEVELDSLVERLLKVVEETMQPDTVSLWLREDGELLETDLKTNGFSTGRP